MHNTGLIFLWVLIILLILQRKKVQRILNVLRIKRKKRGNVDMAHIIEKFIGKDCLINLGSGSTADGVVKSVAEGWIELEGKDGNLQAVNVDYISRIREYPTNKNGKRKVVIE